MLHRLGDGQPCTIVVSTKKCYGKNNQYNATWKLVNIISLATLLALNLDSIFQQAHKSWLSSWFPRWRPQCDLWHLKELKWSTYTRQCVRAVICQNKFLSRATAIVVIGLGPRQIGKPTVNVFNATVGCLVWRDKSECAKCWLLQNERR